MVLEIAPSKSRCANVAELLYGFLRWVHDGWFNTTEPGPLKLHSGGGTVPLDSDAPGENFSPGFFSSRIHFTHLDPHQRSKRSVPSESPVAGSGVTAQVASMSATQAEVSLLKSSAVTTLPESSPVSKYLRAGTSLQFTVSQRSIFAARTKSISLRPSIAWVQIRISTLPQVKAMLG